MAHIDLDFPRNVAAGCLATIERRDEIVTLGNGREEVNQRWADARRTWIAGLAIRSKADLAAVVSIFEAARGRANSFRFKDWLDYSTAPDGVPPSPFDQSLGSGDGSKVSFQLVKSYGVISSYERAIPLPVPGTVVVAVDGVQAVDGWTITAPGGVVTFDAPPPPGSSVTAGFLFDVPVRFLDSSLSIEWEYFNETRGVGSVPEVSLIEVRLD